MKIISFIPVPADCERKGLKPLALKRLGSIVLLAGPNGGGKSRILSLIKEAPQYLNHRSRLGQLEINIENLTKTLDPASLAQNSHHKVHEAGWREQLATQKLDRARILAFEFDDPPEMFLPVNFVPVSALMRDPAALAPNQVSGASFKSAPDAKALVQDALPIIQRIQNRWFEASHPDSPVIAEEREAATREYEALNNLIDALLGEKLSRNLDANATLFDKPIGEASKIMSDGQRVLLQFAVAVHSIAQQPGLLIVMDEPENHLHPAALLSILARLRAALPNAQLWIATHCIPLIAHLYFEQQECLHLVSGGEVQHSGRRPAMVLEGLLGDDTERLKLLNFATLPDQLAATYFAAQCLVAPTVADAAPSDPQLVQIAGVANKCSKSIADEKALRLLDFGAGKGRLLSGLFDPDSDFATRFDYIAFDVDDMFRQQCESALKASYGSAGGRYFNTENDLLASYAETVDLVVMCNVLHEIPPGQWPSVFGKGSVIAGALKPDGHILIVEDLEIPLGELPHSMGFFLLDEFQIQTLFAITAVERDSQVISSATVREGRLKCYLIPVTLLQRVSRATVVATIERLSTMAKQKVKRLRESKERTYKAGQLSSLWTQQFANCQMFLETEGRTPQRLSSANDINEN